MDNYDVIIVGCGPAGTTSGYILGNLGLHTLLVDKNVFPRHKLCGGGLTNKTITLLQRVFNETVASLTHNEIIDYASNSYDIYFRENLLVHGTSHFPFFFVDRFVYDNYLLEKAKETGVIVLEGEKVKKIDIENNILSTSSGRILKARFIIGADGVHSIIRNSFPNNLYDKKRWEYNLSTALEIFVPRSEINRELNYPIIHFGYVDWGYSWMFPNRNEIIIGLGGLNRKNTKKYNKIFRDYISDLTSFYQIKHSDHVKIYGHPVPTGNCLKKPIYRNIMLVGDAAGFSDSISGEGIYQAQRSAEIAALSIWKSLSNGLPLERTFLNLLKRYIFPDIFYAKILRWFVFNALKNLNFNQIQRLTRYGERTAIDIVHGLKTYKFFQSTDGLHGNIP